MAEKERPADNDKGKGENPVRKWAKDKGEEVRDRKDGKDGK